MKRFLAVLLLLLLLPAAVLAASSSGLTKVVTETEEGTRTDYVDSEGRLTVADDLGYASALKRTEGSISTETYYDAAGNPVRTKRGYYGKRVEHISETFVRATYLDAQGNPAPLNAGYTVFEQTYEDGRIVLERAFDADGTPAVYSLGCHAISRRYGADGHTVRFTYLGTDCLPTVNSLGYDTVRRVYDDDGNLTEEWYELGGLPVKKSGGDYGVRIVNGKRVDVDLDGEGHFNLASFLTARPWLCWLGFAAALLLIPLLPKRLLKAAGAVYIVFLLYLTLMERSSGGQRFNFELFWSYRSAVTSPDLKIEILYNIAIFVPLGTMAACLSPGCRMMLWPFALSFLIETVQLVTGRGLCELDDLFNNTLGGCLGFGFGLLAQRLLTAVRNRKKTEMCEKA